MKKLFVGFLFLCCWASGASADYISPIPYPADVNGEIIEINNNLTNVPFVVAAGVSLTGSATNNITYVKANITDSTTNPPVELNNHYVTGGMVFNNTASGNAVHVSNNATISGKAVAGGLALLHDNNAAVVEVWREGKATNNTVTISNAKVDVSSLQLSSDAVIFTLGSPIAVVGGASQYINADVSGNTVEIDNSTITGAVVGGWNTTDVTEEDLQSHEISYTVNNNNNTISIKNGSTINGDVIGAYGGAHGNRNTITIDNSTVVGNVLAGINEWVIYNQGSSEGLNTFSNNTINILNGASIQGTAMAFLGGGVVANGNTVNLAQSSISNGSLYSVVLLPVIFGGTPMTGFADNNTLAIDAITGGLGNLYELGASINMSGNPAGNTTIVKNANGTLKYDPTKTFYGFMNTQALSTKKLLNTQPAYYDKLSQSHGYIFGGATADYTTTSLDAEGNPVEITIGYGSSANGNSVFIEDGTVGADVIGGFASYIREVDYEKDDREGGVGTVTKVHKRGLVTTTTVETYSKDETTGVITSTTETTQEVADLINDVFSASDNKIVLKNVGLTGNVYGGFVDGAELKLVNQQAQNNTVVIAGKTTLSASSMVYGGNNPAYGDTNHLVFSHSNNGSGGFVRYNPSQFKYFNSLWTIEADLDTRLQFDGAGVYAQLLLDPSVMQDSAPVTLVKTDFTNASYGPLICNGTENCKKYNADIYLPKNKLGIYSFELTPTLNGDYVDWTLSSYKDESNLETYGQLPLVGLALAIEGQEMLGTTISDAWANDNESNTFLNGAYHHTRYKTGSGFDLNSGIFQLGAWKKFTSDWLGGLFAKYAHGSYKTFPIDVNGTADVFAGGVLSSLRYSETGRFEVDAEIGYMNMDFKSPELSSEFKSKGFYYGAGAGIVENVVESLDLFANLRLLRKEKNNITDSLGKEISFKAMQSMALRFGAQYAFNQWDISGLKPSVGVMGIYELDGKSKVASEDIQTDEASMKGLTGRAQVSLIYENNDTFLPLRTGLTVYGLAGKREGFGGEVNITFSF